MLGKILRFWFSKCAIKQTNLWGCLKKCISYIYTCSNISQAQMLDIYPLPWIFKIKKIKWILLKCAWDMLLAPVQVLQWKWKYHIATNPIDFTPKLVKMTSVILSPASERSSTKAELKYFPRDNWAQIQEPRYPG